MSMSEDEIRQAQADLDCKLEETQKRLNDLKAAIAESRMGPANKETEGQVIPAEDFARIVNDMAAVMSAAAVWTMDPAAEEAGRRNAAALGLRALLDAGYVPVRPVGEEG